MARYLVGRSFPGGLAIPVTAEGAQVCLTVAANHAVDGVTWVPSNFTPDETGTFCVHDALPRGHPHRRKAKQPAGG